MNYNAHALVIIHINGVLREYTLAQASINFQEREK